MFKSQIILSIIAVVAVVALYNLPNVVVDNEQLEINPEIHAAFKNRRLNADEVDIAVFVTTMDA